VILKNIVGALADFGKCPFCMQKWVTKLAGTGHVTGRTENTGK
jgi:hypothetical protein